MARSQCGLLWLDRMLEDKKRLRKEMDPIERRSVERRSLASSDPVG